MTLLSFIEWVGIAWGNPLIELRLFLAAIWLVAGIYSLVVLRRIPEGSHWKPLTWYSAIASFLGAASYFIGAATTFSSPVGFMIIALLLSFTPISLALWQHFGALSSKDDKEGEDQLDRIEEQIL